MAQPSTAVLPPRRFGGGRIAWWLFVLVSFALLFFLLGTEVMRFSTPGQLQRLQIVQDIPLPDALPDAQRSHNPLAAGQAERFDHLDFQALDPQTHLLFIAHSGPNPVKEHALNPAFDPARDGKTDGNVVVFDTQRQKVVGLLPIPHGAGVTVAPDLGRAYVGDALDGIIYAIDERTLHMTPIQLDAHDGPDDIEYDPVDHKLFVSDPGIPVNPDQTAIPARQNQNLAVIDALTNQLVTKILLGNDGSKFGDDVGHTWFDPISHRQLVITLPLPNLDDPNASVTPPSFLTVINPLTVSIVTRIQLPNTCVNPHGMTIDVEQREVFIACIGSQNLVRVDLLTMRPFPDTTHLPLGFNPDIVRLDHLLHVLVVGCVTGYSVFDESGRGLKKLGNYFLGGGSHHTVAIDEATQLLYLPLPSVGDRPILRVIRYVPNGA